MEKEKLKNYFNEIAPERDYWKRKNRYYHKEIESLCQFLVPSKSHILEIGCGTGDLLNALKPKKGIGIDFSEKMIEIAQKKYPQLEFKVMEAERLKLKEKFDYIILSDLIGFLPDIEKVFQELKKVSHKKTRIIITYYNYLWEPILKLAEKLRLKIPEPLQNWLSFPDLQNLLYLSNFEVIKKGERLLFPKYLPLISCFFNKYLAKLPLLRNFCLSYYLVAKPNFQEERDYSVSVIIPCRNEKGNIEEAVKRVPEMGKNTEIIFVEGHSADDTLEEIKKVVEKYKEKRALKWTVQDGEGKGDAVRKGFEMASGDVLMILDADLTVSPEDLPKFYQAIKTGKGEFISGCRLVYPMEKEAMRTLNLLGNKFFSIMFSWLLDQKIKDTLCGTKVLFKEDYQRIKEGRKFFGEFDPFGDFDLLFGASKLNLKIIEIPIRYQERKYGTTNISRFRHGWLLLRMCLFAMKKIKFI